VSKDGKQLKRIAGSLEAMQPAVTGRDTSSEPRTTKEIRKVSRPILYRLRVWLFTSPAKSRVRVAERMQFPIMGFVGPNGGGKTAAAVAMALVALRSGRRVLSTVPLLDPATGQPHPLYVPWTHWDQLLDWWDGDVLADEILSIASSRGAASLDPRAQTLLGQLRKRNCRFWWTAPNFRRADVIIREVTQAITECRGFYPSRGLSQERRGVIQSWAPKRLFSFKTYDAIEFDDWTAGKRDQATPLVAQWFHGPGSDVFAAYDTLGAVSVIAGVGEAGLCDGCGGTVTTKPKPCRCAVPKLRPHDFTGEVRPDRVLLPGEVPVDLGLEPVEPLEPLEELVQA
jgi:hypothetical protein